MKKTILPLTKTFILFAVLGSFAACEKANKLADAGENVSAMGKTTESMDEKMNTTNGEISKTNESVRLQKMQISLDHMTNQQSMDRLYPVPSGLMPWAKIFAESAKPTEIVELAYLWLKEIDEVTPFKRIDSVTGKEIAFNAGDKNQILLEKFTRFQALSAIAGFAPQETVDQMILQEITGRSKFGEGRYRQTALSVLMLRAIFVRQVLLQESILKTGQFEDVGSAEKSIEYMRLVDQILRLPFRDQIKIKTVGLKAPAEYNGPIANADLRMADADLLGFFISGWTTIADMTENSLVISEKNDHGHSEEDKLNCVRDQNRKAQVLREAKESAKRLQ